VTAQTLGDYYIPNSRCSSCSAEFPLSVPVELHEASSSHWLVVTCTKCGRCTPFRLDDPEDIEA
jgi:RNase P subunit RPR2